MAMKLNGLQATLSTFRQVDKRFSAAAAAELERGAKEIAKLARDFAPVDKGLLVRSLRAQRVMTTQATAWRVTIGGNVEYAMRVHEVLQYTRGEKTNGPSGTNPRKRSREKAARLGVTVGRKFLTRAFDAKREEIQERIRRAIANEANQIARKSGVRRKK